MSLVSKYLETVKNEKVEMSYWVQLPEKVTEDMPVLVFLHGSGGHRVLNSLKPDDGIFPLNEFVEKTYEYPFIVIEPALPTNADGKYAVRGWVGVADLVIEALDKVVKRYKADEDRVYLSGFSMGGRGTWDVAALYPDRFAALMPSGWYGEPSLAPKLVHIPIWTLNGRLDEICNIHGANRIVDAFIEAGGVINYTLYAGIHSLEDETLSEGNLRWLLKHNRKDNAVQFEERIKKADERKNQIANAPVYKAAIGSPKMTEALDPVWEKATPVTLKNEDFSGEFKVLWDNENIYVLCRIKDSGENDSVEVFIDMERKINQVYNEDTFHYILDRNNEYKVLTPALEQGTLKSRILQADECIYEMAIPRVGESKVLGLEVYLNKYIDGRRTVCTWYDKENLAWTDPGSFGVLEL